MNKKQIADFIYDATLDVSAYWLEKNKKKTINKQYWAFLHMGFVAGLKMGGFDEKVIEEALVDAQDRLITWENMNKKLDEAGL